MRKAVRTGALAWVLGMLAFTALSPGAQEIVPVGAALFSAPADIQFVGDYLYVIYPSGFAVVNASSPYEPSRIAERAIPGEGRGIFAGDSLVYLSCGTGGLVTVDVSVPWAPVMLDTVPAGSSFGRIVENRGRILVADDRDGLVIFGLDDPGHPEKLSAFDVGVEIEDMVAAGRVAYLATELAGVQLVDISSWEGVPLTGLVELAPANDLVLSGDTLFVARGALGIAAVDVADSSAPSILAGTWVPPDTLDGIAGIDSLLAAVAGDSVLLFRKSDLSGGPVGVVEDTSGIGRVFRSGNLVALASERDGVVLSDLILPKSTALLTRYLPGNFTIQTVSVLGDSVFLGTSEAGVFLASLENPLEPESLGVIVTDGNVLDCDVRRSLLYTIEDRDTPGGVRIYDVAAGERIANLSLPGIMTEMTRSDSILYVCAVDRGVYVLDVSDSSAPALVDSVPIGSVSNRFARSVDIAGDLAAVAEGTAGLRILDLSDPLHPVELGAYNPFDFVSDVVWGEGGRLYVCLRTTGVLVLDVNDPEAPDSVGVLDIDPFFDKPILLEDIIRSAEFLYITGYGGIGGSGDLHIVSIDDPDGPEYVKAVESSGNPYDIRLVGNTIHVAAGSDGYEQYGVFNDFDLIRRGRYRPSPPVSLAGASDSRILIVDDEGGVWPLAVVGGESLAVGERYDLGGPANDLFVEERRAFVALNGEDRLAMFDLPLSTQAFFSRWIPLDAAAQGVDVVDSLLYVAQGTGGLAVFDVSRTDTVIRVGSYVTDGVYDLGGAAATSVRVSDGVAYVVTRDRTNSLFLLDVTDPSAIEALGTYGSGRRAFHVAVYGGYAYLTQRITGMEVIDVQNPANPLFVIDRNDMFDARFMEIAEDALFVARRTSGLSVLDLTNAYNPSVIFNRVTAGAVDDLALHSSYLVLADRNAARVFLQDFANADQQAPGYTVGILPNTFANAYVDFIVVASEALIEAPKIRFSMGETDSLLSVFPLNTVEHIYHAGYRLTQTGIGSVRVEGEDLAGNKSETSRGFSVSYVRGAKGGSIYDAAGKVEVAVPASGAADEGYVILLPASSYELADRMNGMPDPVAGPFRVALGSLEGPVTVRLHGVEPVEEGPTPALWRLEGSTWVRVEGAYDAEKRVVEAGLPGSSFFLFSPEGGAPAPFVVRLDPNRPNPFNPTTTLRFYLSRPASARLAVYDVAGRMVRLLFDGKSPAGWNDVVWNGENGSGRPVGSGIYLSRLEAAGLVRTGKMILLR
ncbi:MAG: hypothetical protein JW958_00750 [Candidatus Eisenbacteria bacterium]|nr:hypothetical protein [Candidatus Eisenbacteria bacterium]